ncbi:MAG: helix-turn-helix domain-containing protein [Nitrososphaerota archaeon]
MSLWNYLFLVVGIFCAIVGIMGNVSLLIVGLLLISSMWLTRMISKSTDKAVMSRKDVVSLIFNEREAKIIEVLLHSPGGLSLTEISNLTGMSRSATYRLLKKLSSRGVIVALKEGSFNKYALSSEIEQILRHGSS